MLLVRYVCALFSECDSVQYTDRSVSDREHEADENRVWPDASSSCHHSWYVHGPRVSLHIQLLFIIITNSKLK